MGLAWLTAVCRVGKMEISIDVMMEDACGTLMEGGGGHACDWSQDDFGMPCVL